MPNDSSRRPDPQHLLEQLELQERQARRGKLKVFLGYASGVGKSYQMLDEGRRRRMRGEDVVIGATQQKSSPEVEQLLRDAEIIAPLVVDGQVTVNVAALLGRHPQVVMIDGLAYDNPPGSTNAKRWQDVEQLLDAGISVITSVNLQYIQELQGEVERITGKRATQSIPKSFLEAADEIAIVDAPAEVSLAHGSVMSVPGRVVSAEEQKLSRLREIALLVTAEVVDRQLEAYLKAHGIEALWGTQERILVCVTPRSSAAPMLASGRRNADRFHGELYAVYVKQPAVFREDRAILERNLALAREIGAQVEVLDGLDAVETIIEFARAKGITQIFIGHSRREGGWRRLWSNFVDRIIRAAEGIDVSVFPH
jgi:two-component system sensor histidine kinase KdpD